ncbi:MAG TPA: hypothetical protein VF169_08130 [Albitalea sp.]|uniref:hypothetical protein n=1 Tax=Piscinibacter sp. TaxID=1903157 RepID=UPI002ED4A9CD
MQNATIENGRPAPLPQETPNETSSQSSSRFGFASGGQPPVITQEGLEEAAFAMRSGPSTGGGDRLIDRLRYMFSFGRGRSSYEPMATGSHPSSDEWPPDGNWLHEGGPSENDWGRMPDGEPDETWGFVSGDDRWNEHVPAGEYAPTEDWAKTTDITPLIPSQAEASPASSESSYQTLVDFDLTVGLNLSALYNLLGKALHDDYEHSPPVRSNCWSPDPGVQRQEMTSAEYVGRLHASVKQCKPPRLGEATDAASWERFEFVSKELGTLLAGKPPRNARSETADLLSRLKAGLAQARPRVTDETACAALAVCEQKARALVVDVAMSDALTGRALVSFLEKVCGNDMQAMLKCTIELAPARQTEVFDGSSKLRTALRIRSGIRGELANAAGKVFHPRQLGLSMPLSQAAEGWAYAAIHSRRGSIKNNALERIEEHLSPKLPTRAGLVRLKNRVVKPVPQPLHEFCGSVVALLGEGAPFMERHAERAGGFVKAESEWLTDKDKSRILASMLICRAAMKRAGTDTAGVDGHPCAWLDELIDSMGLHIPEALVQIRDDQVAAAMLPWLCGYVKELLAPALKLRNFVRQIHGVATSMPAGPRRDMLLQALLEAKESLPRDHPSRLLINSALRNAGQEWANRTGRPQLIHEIKKEELRLYPKLIASGHAFKKHVQGKHNRCGKQFDQLIGSGGTKEERRQRYEKIIRDTMQAPTDLYINLNHNQYLYAETTGVQIALDPIRGHGGTAHTCTASDWARKVRAMPCTKLPSDTYANLPTAAETAVRPAQTAT